MHKEMLHKALCVMRGAKIVLPKSAEVNIYHHCGKDRFEQTGAVFINIVNRDYCKSYVIMLPGQRYPCHYHKIKTESFYVLYGILNVEADGRVHKLMEGEMLHIERGMEHAFWSDTGTVFEEISTNYTRNDSFYMNEEIQKTSYAQRRTVIEPEEWKEVRMEWKE